ncbi:phosphoribosylglycinamide formyltransferase [Mesonia aestuariivivens]|uniref:Phosphoribosylglycinamide formyltransferase n=1 Tax=Mesonia aestuariivivens TaxID=2796128 RepID=A0ABS6VX81_9FLAO|nr:phosphoribosylglycinamide formyltransferase [Mesonia aestuariivivens]MBW2960213.1 phosphoribosylglycinamide formyltransferase [Mesonia aestuariivivens]
MNSSNSTKKIVIFASGQGSNAKNIIRYFQDRNDVKISHVLSNNIRANVLKMAHEHEINSLHFDREALYHSNEILHILKDTNPDLIVLAGFLWIMPQEIIAEFENKIINLHPALLPKYGGKGMYGNYVHQAVLENKEKESGITIHYVNEKYDEGKTIAQFSTSIETNESMETLKKKIQQLEHENFPKVIDELLSKKS